MRNSIAATTPVLLFVAGLAVAQTASQPQAPPPQTTQKPSPDMTVKPTTQLVGCLYREEQVPGRKPNVAERAGILEDYILVDAKIAKPETTTNALPASGNVYKVEGPPDDQLKALVGKRVEVTGRIDPEGSAAATKGAPTADRGPGPDQINLPEFEASSIREVSGTCPATPARK